MRNRKPFSSNSFYLGVLRKISNSVTKITICPHGGIKKKDFLDQLFTNIFRPKIVILDPDSNLRAKTMYESVK